MKKHYFILLFSFLSLNLAFMSNSIFDGVSWNYETTARNINLYIKETPLYEDNFYKAETIIDKFDGETLFNNLLKFNSYPSIFPKTIVFKPIKSIDKNKFLTYTQINFFPYKTRDYYIETEYSVNYYDKDKKIYIFEWKPTEDKINETNLDSKCVRVNKVFGRWMIKELDDGKVSISIEYHHNFKVDVSKKLREYFEKANTAKNK